jgi:hypothetical protein
MKSWAAHQCLNPYAIMYQVVWFVTGDGCTQSVIVKSRTTCTLTAIEAGIPAGTVHHINRYVDCNNVLPGQQLCLYYIKGCGQGYITKPGDTCLHIWLNYTPLTWQDFLSLNQGAAGVRCDALPGGSVVCIAPSEYIKEDICCCLQLTNAYPCAKPHQQYGHE